MKAILKNYYTKGMRFADTQFPKFLQKLGLSKGAAEGVSAAMSAYAGYGAVVAVPLAIAGVLISGAAAVLPTVLAGTVALALFSIPAVFGAGMFVGSAKMTKEKRGVKTVAGKVVNGVKGLFGKKEAVAEAAIPVPSAESKLDTNTTTPAVDFKNAVDGTKSDTVFQTPPPAPKDAPTV